MAILDTLIVSALKTVFKKAGTTIGTRRSINLIDGTVTATLVDDAANDKVDVTLALAPRATYQNQPGTPVALTAFGGLYKMFGLAGAITPTASGTVLFIISGSTKTSTSPGYSQLKLYTGTGAAPANAAAVTGTARTGPTVYEVSATVEIGFCLQAVVTGLTPGTAVWFDLAGYDAGNGNSVTVELVNMTAVEL